MTIKMYAIKDTVANMYMMPNPFRTEPEALRAFGQAVNFGQAGTMLKEFPADLEIYEVGAFDDDAGKFVFQDPRFICKASDLIRSQSEEVK